MTMSHSIAPLCLIFRVSIRIATVNCYVVLGRLALIDNTRGLVREGLLHDHHRLGERFMEVTEVR